MLITNPKDQLVTRHDSAQQFELPTNSIISERKEENPDEKNDHPVNLPQQDDQGWIKLGNMPSPADVTSPIQIKEDVFIVVANTSQHTVYPGIWSYNSTKNEWKLAIKFKNRPDDNEELEIKTPVTAYDPDTYNLWIFDCSTKILIVINLLTGHQKFHDNHRIITNCDYPPHMIYLDGCLHFIVYNKLKDTRHLVYDCVQITTQTIHTFDFTRIF